MYFEVLSADPNDAFLAAGLTEDLIVDFARVEALRVASRSEVAPFRERPVPPRTLGRELNVDYVLLGSVRHAGPRARISAQLVRASDGHVVWAERFDRTLEDLFDVQAEVSKHIVEALQVRLAPAEKEMLKRAPTKSAEAYARYLEARALLDQRRYESNQKAEALLQKAIAEDPRFALAHATLGEAYAQRALSWWEGLEAVEQAEPAVQRALALEPDLVEAHLVQAMIHRLRGEPEKLLRALERLLVLDPDSAEALHYTAWSYMALGRYEEARPILQRLVDRHPDRLLAPGWLADIDELEGRKTEASARLHRLALERALDVVRRDPGNWHAQSILTIQLIQTGDREQALAQAERVAAGAPANEGQVHYNVACAFARLGLPDRALKELREATSRLPSYIADWPRRDPDLASLHDHPEFIRMFGKA
jgi:adenylate cyclase